MTGIQIKTISLPNLAAAAPTRADMMAAGGELAKQLREYWRIRGSGKFWGEIAEATLLDQASVTDTAATVAVSPPHGYYLIHKIKGGLVTAKPPRKMLAIPANQIARAAGWPSHWSLPGDDKLKVLWGKNGPYALALKSDLLKWKKNGLPGASQKSLREGEQGNWGKGVIMYWLKRAVFHWPDPNALPPWDIVETNVAQAFEESIFRRLSN